MDWIHVVGIGGIAMSAIAKSFLKQGYKVTGSDLEQNKRIVELQKEGVEISLTHKPENIKAQIDKVIYSDAIPADNVELKQARKFELELLNRSEALSLLTANHKVVSATGTHGKTTTSSLISYLLSSGGLKPSFIVGGIMNNFSTNFSLGSGELFVLEGDEYGKSFLQYESNLGVVTNIQFDHPDIYTDLAEMEEAYRQYIRSLNELLVTNQSVLNQLDLDPVELEAEVKTVGIKDPKADYNVTSFCTEELTSYFTLEVAGQEIGNFTLPARGKYNIRHAVEAIAICKYCGLEFSQLRAALKEWQGVKRRFEVLARSEQEIVITDYAHHPQEVKAVVSSLADIKTPKEKVVIFQPHQYLRTKSLFTEYENLLDYDIDQLILYQIYKVREQVSSEELESLGQKLTEVISPDPVKYLNDWSQLKTHLMNYSASAGVIYLFLGAGNIDQFAREWVKN